MSTSSFPFSDGDASHNELPNGVFGDGLSIEKSVLDFEPKARELNRHLVSLLGRCPSNPTGAWVTISTDDNGDPCLALSSVDFSSALHLVARLSEINTVLEDNEPAFVSSNRYQSDLGPEVVGDGAALTNVPRTHVRRVNK